MKKYFLSVLLACLSLGESQASSIGHYLIARHAEQANDFSCAAYFTAAALQANPLSKTLTEKMALLLKATDESVCSREKECDCLDFLESDADSALQDTWQEYIAARNRHLENLSQEAWNGPINDLDLPFLAARILHNLNDPAALRADFEAIDDTRTLLKSIFVALSARWLNIDTSPLPPIRLFIESVLPSFYDIYQDPGILRYHYALWLLKEDPLKAQETFIATLLTHFHPESIVLRFVRFLRRSQYHALAQDLEERYYQGNLIEYLTANEVFPPDLRLDPQDGYAEILYDLALLSDSPLYKAFYVRLGLSLDSAPSVLFSLGHTFREVKRYDESTAIFEQVSTHPRLGFRAKLRIGYNLLALKRYDQAERFAETLVQEHPDNALSVFLLWGAVYAEQGEWEKAIEVYHRAFQLFPEESFIDRPSLRQQAVNIYYRRAAVYQRLGNFQAAEEDYQKLLALDPKHVNSLNNLGYLWADRNVNLEQAKEMIARALDSEGDSVAIQDSMGWVFYRLNDLEKAVSYLERASERAVWNPTINDHLGDVYWALERYDEARFQWRKTLDLLLENPQDHQETIQQVQEKLSNSNCFSALCVP